MLITDDGYFERDVKFDVVLSELTCLWCLHASMKFQEKNIETVHIVLQNNWKNYIAFIMIRGMEICKKVKLSFNESFNN